MDYRNYRYEIRVIPVKPPVGVQKFGADISFLAKLGPGKATQLHPDIGEALGKTEKEAFAGFEIRLKKWIDAQG
jgi:hypothetical protein